MEWSIITVIISMVGLLTAIITPIIKLNSTISKLTTQMDNLLSGLTDFKQRYKEHLEELHSMDEQQNQQLANHEHRITILESAEKN